MSDDLERRLRTTLHRAELPGAPASLRAYVEHLPLSASVKGSPERRRWLAPAVGLVAVAALIVAGLPVLLSGLPSASPRPSAFGSSTPTPDARPSPSLVVTPSPVAPGRAWTSVSWSETDPTVFGGPGNQFIFGGTSWAGGYVLVGEEAPLPQGAVTGVVWVSADATHWSRLPDTARVFDHAEIGSIAAHGSTLVAIGQPRPDNPAAVQPPLTLEWTSTDGIHWVRNRGADSTIGTMSYATVLAGPTGFIAYGNTQNSSLVLLFSHDGLDWQRVGAGDSAFADASIGQITWTGTSYVAVGTRLQPGSPGATKTPPGPAVAWWSADGITWHAADVGNGGYAINYFGAVLDGVVNAYGDSGGGGISPPIGWRSIDDGRTWRSLGPQTEAPGFGYLSTSLPVNGRVVRLTQSLPPLSEWSQDGETWRSLEASGSPLPQETRLMIAGDGMLIAVGQLEKSLSNDQVDSLVYVGVMR